MAESEPHPSSSGPVRDRDELVAAGADVVVVDGPDTTAEIAAAIGQAPVRLAIESVGGQIAEKLIDLLAPGGTLVRYSAKDEIDKDGHGAAKGVKVEFLSTATMDFPTKIAPVIAETVPLLASGALHVPVAAVYDLAEINPAIAHLKRGGKILLHIQD